MRGFRLAVMTLALRVALGVVEAGAGPAPPPPCMPDGGEPVTIAGIDEDFSLRLADGRLIRLAGIDPVRATPKYPALPATAREHLSAWLVGKPAVLRLVATGPDRWGRLAGLAFAPQGAGSAGLSIALAMVDAGLARGRPEAETEACWSALLAAEDGARKAGLGLWGDPYYAVRNAADGWSLASAAGGMVVAEGRVTHVGQTRTRLYLDLGPGRDALALRLDRRNVFILGQLGKSQSDWVGRFVRVRGYLDDRHGPRIDLLDRDQIERLDGASASQ